MSAKYAGADFKSKHSSTTTATKNVVSVAYIQNLFTVSVDFPVVPSALFSDDFSMIDVTEQERLGRIGPDNIPVFLGTVSYGRIMYVTISSSRSMQDVKDALSASYHAGSTGGTANYTDDQKKILTESEMQISAIGVEEANAANIIISGKVQEFFKTNMDVRSSRPLSYIFYNLGDLSIAALAESAEYNITVCQPKSVPPSKEVSDRAGTIAANMTAFRNFVTAAGGNAHDPGTRTTRVHQFEACNQQVVSNLSTFKDQLASNSLSPDDKAWIHNWAPSQVTVLEQQAKDIQSAYNGNSRDPGTRAVYGYALNLLGSQRTLLNAVSEQSA